jgi:hypothetical protein
MKFMQFYLCLFKGKKGRRNRIDPGQDSAHGPLTCTPKRYVPCHRPAADKQGPLVRPGLLALDESGSGTDAITVARFCHAPRTLPKSPPPPSCSPSPDATRRHPREPPESLHRRIRTKPMHLAGTLGTAGESRSHLSPLCLILIRRPRLDLSRTGTKPPGALDLIQI